MKHAPVRHALEYAVWAPLVAIHRVLPRAGARALGGALGSLASRAWRGRMALARANVSRALPHLQPAAATRIARASFRHLGATVADSLGRALSPEAFCRRLELQGFSHLHHARDQRQGVIFLRAHLGAWEVAAHTLGLYGFPTHLIGRPFHHPPLERAVRNRHERYGNLSVPEAGAGRVGLRVLRAGGSIGLWIDQEVPRRDGSLVDLFGSPACTSPLPARLSLRTGAPVVPLIGSLAPRGRYLVEYLEPVLPRAVVPGADHGDDAVARLTAIYLGVIEQCIRARPEQWLWMLRRWI